MTRHGVMNWLVLASMALAGAAAPALAQAPPTLRDDIATATQPSPQQIAQLERFVQYWAEQLAESQTVEAAREALVRPLINTWQPPSQAFLFEYSKLLVPRLETIIEGADAHAAVNALQLAGYLASNQAIDLLLEQLAREDAKLRSAAAEAIRLALATDRSPAARMNAVVRELRRAAEQEAEWFVLQNQLGALAAAETPDARDAIAAALASAFQRQRAAPRPDVELIRWALYPIIYKLRNDFPVNLSATQQAALGKTLGPALLRLFDLALTHWETAQADPVMKERFEKAIQLTETFLRTIDVAVRPNVATPQTTLGGTWTSGDRAAFERDVDTWRSILEQLPYEPLVAVAGP